jgi:uncharacterized protein YndB with AHSA1/START domain
MTVHSDLSTQVYQVFIKATPERIWAAITDPDETARYPPRRLAHEWRTLSAPELGTEEPSRVTWEIEPQEGGACRVIVTHDPLEGAPRTAESVSGPGWMFVLSGLTTVLETGASL